MPSKIDNISTALGLINASLPGVISLIATFRGGQQVDIKKLLDDTDAKLEGILSSGAAFLALPDPAAETPEPPVPATPTVDVTPESPPDPPAPGE